MNQDHHDPGPGPTPEELAAYADGELTPPDRARLDDWLRGHPDAAREVEAWRQLDRIYQRTSPEEPSADAWARTGERIDAALAAQRRRPSYWTIGGLGAAAAVLALILGRPLWQAAPTPESVPVEPFAVASADEIQILSMDPADADALVIGTPLVPGLIELVAHGDVAVVRVEAHPDNGAIPDMWAGVGSGGPMIVPVTSDDK